VYNVNKAVGLASSGVEYAQKYRREVFSELSWVEDYYVFTDYIATNLAVYTDLLGFAHRQVLWIYNLVAGRDTAPCTLSLDDFVATLAQPHTVTGTSPQRTDITVTGSPVRYQVHTLDGGLVDRVDTVVGDQLVRVAHYDQSLHNVEHFCDNQLARRTFYTTDGRVAAEQSYRNREITRTVFTAASPVCACAAPHRQRPSAFAGSTVVEGRSQFFQTVFAHLLDRPDDVVVVDRAVDVIDGIYPVVGDHRLFSVVHAEHFDLRQADDGVLLWNNHYENVFTRPDLVDGLIVATTRQQQALHNQLAAQGPAARIPVVPIPPGVARPQPPSPQYDRLALVTASRLADEKHIDILIRAVAAAREVLPGLHLDVYGEGNRDGLLATIGQTQTHDCVHLLGHQQLDGVLGSYGLYVSASTSEGFGLSVLEAIAHGLPVVGFDVDYGNRELVEPGVNGRLVPCTSSDDDVTALADAIVEVLTCGSLEAMRNHSARKAQAYTTANVGAAWARLLRGDQPC